MGEMADLALDQMMDTDELQIRYPTFEEAQEAGVEETIYDYDGTRYPHVFSRSSFRNSPMVVKVLSQGNRKVSSRPRSESGFLDSIEETMAKTEETGLIVLEYGLEGVGKSSWAAHAPGPVVFVCGRREHGIHELRRAGLVPEDIRIGRDVSSFGDGLAVMDELAEVGDVFTTVVIDSLSVFEQMCFEECCNKDFDGDWGKTGFLSFMQGPRSAAESYWPQFTDRIVGLKEAGLNVVLTAHGIIKTFKNPEGPDYDRYTTMLTDPIYKKTAQVADCILFMKHNTDVQTEKGKRSKAIGGDKRAIYTEYDAAYDAKNRWSLPTMLGPSDSPKELADEFWNKVKKARQPSEAGKAKRK